MSAKEEEAVPSPVPPEPTSWWRRFAARLFAPERHSAALAVLWFIVASAYLLVFLGRGGVGQSFGNGAVLALAGNTFTSVPDPGAFVQSRLGRNQGEELWKCVYDFEIEQTRYRTVLRCRFDVPMRVDMRASPLGPPPANLVPAARQEVADRVRDQYVAYPHGGEFVDMLAAGQGKRTVWRPYGRVLYGFDWFGRLFLITPVLLFTVRAIRRTGFKRRHARCLSGLCPICRYPLADLTTSTCPECGCDTAAACAEAAHLLGAVGADQTTSST